MSAQLLCVAANEFVDGPSNRHREVDEAEEGLAKKSKHGEKDESKSERKRLEKRSSGHGLVVSHLGPNPTQGHFV